MKKCLLIQPGAYGDIFVCAPIAKIYHDNGYKVYWPTTQKFQPLIERFNYVEHVLLEDASLDPDWLRSDVIKCLSYLERNSFDVVLNLADRGPHLTAEQFGENFELCKYRLSQIPIEYKHNLGWVRNEQKESELYDKVVKDDKYAVVHLNSSRGDRAALPENFSIPVVEVTEIPGYDICDWFKVIKNASEIYCVESAVHQFIDGTLEHTGHIPKYLLSRSTLGSQKRYTYTPYWKTDYLL